MSVRLSNTVMANLRAAQETPQIPGSSTPAPAKVSRGKKKKAAAAKN